jgi:murein DD-endopeptidase MepM/ murein hydrolase activator NlpD
MARLASLAGLGAALVLVAAQAPPAMAANPPCPSLPPGAAATSSRICTNQSPSADDILRQRLGGDLAQALTTQQQLATSLDQASASEQLLTDQLMLEESKVADLQDQIAQLDQQIADLQSRIDDERAQVATLARAMYVRPATFLDIIASSGNLADVLTKTADLVIAGQRAHALQDRLQSDLASVQTDRAARQADLDQVNTTLAQVQAGLDQLSSIQGQIDDLASQMADLIGQIQQAEAAIGGQPADVTAQLAQLLEQQEAQLVQQSNAAAWAQATVGAGLLAVTHQLPTGAGPSGLRLSWPLLGAHITQMFGPTSFALEPPLGSYLHFHTGVDLAAPLGSPVLAAADGVVVAVGHTKVGYGNYVIIDHGSGVMTLYGHLLQTDVTVGQAVIRTELIGLEGMSGLATGPHLHFEVRINGQAVDPMRYLPQA